MHYKFLGSERKGGYSVVVVRILAGKNCRGSGTKEEEARRKYAGNIKEGYGSQNRKLLTISGSAE